MAASCRKISVLLAVIFLTFSPQIFAATGDAKIVYGESGTGVLRTRDYTNSTSGWGAEGNSSTTATVVRYVVTKASPQSNEYVTAAASNPSGSTMTLYITRHDGAAWNLDVNGDTTLYDSTATRPFDVAYEQSSGNWLVVFSNGGTSNELSYYYRSCNVNGGNGTCTLIGPCTKESNRTTAAVEWVMMDSRPSSNEIAVAFSDANDDLSALIWKPTSEYVSTCAATTGFWVDEPAAALETTLSTTNSYKFDVAYEQTSGDALIAWYANASSDLDYSTHANGGGAWSAASTNTSFGNAAIDIDLCPEPGSNKIGVASLTNSGTSADTETGIWDGGAWGNISTDLDATAESNLSMHSIACGFIGTSGKMVAVFNDEQTTGDIDFLSWTSGGGWVTGTDASYSAGTEQERNISIYNFPGENKIMAAFATSLSDLWTAKYDGTTWTFLNTAAALETSMSDTTTLNSGAQGVALTAFSATPVAELLTMSAQKDTDSVKLSWNTKTESLIGGYHVTRAEKDPTKPNAPLKFVQVDKKLIAPTGGPLAGGSYSFIDSNVVEGKEYVYRIEALGRNSAKVAVASPVIVPDAGGRATFVDMKTGKTSVTSIDKPAETDTRLKRTGEKVRLSETDGAVTEQIFKPRPTSVIAPPVVVRAVPASGAAAITKIKEQLAQNIAKLLEAEKNAKKQDDKPATSSGGKKQDPPPAPAAKSLVPAIQLTITQSGVYRVSGKELADAGWDLAKLKPETLAMVAGGVAVPIRLVGIKEGKFALDSAVEFVGEPIETRYFKENIYWLLQLAAGGARMTERADPKINGFDVRSYDHKLYLGGDEAYYSEPPTDAHWFFGFELFSGLVFEKTLPLSEVNFSSDSARLVIGLQGLSTIGYADAAHNRQHVVISLNGQVVGEHQWSGDTYTKAEFDVPTNVLVEGDNALTIEASDEEGTLEQMVLVDCVELNYSRKLIANGQGIVFPGRRLGGRATYKIKNLSSESVQAYVLRRDDTVEFITGFDVSSDVDGFTVTVSDGRPQLQASDVDVREDDDMLDAQGVMRRRLRRELLRDRFVVVPSTAVKKADKIVMDKESDLLKGKLQPYVVIAPKLFHETLAPFVLHRTASLVDVQDIFDEYSYGFPDPAAIRDFLVSAASRGVEMALLAGDGHYDYRNFQATNVPEYVPVALAPTRFGEAVSDTWFGTPEGELVPKLAIGRWPVKSTAEVEALMSKTLVYEQQVPTSKALFMTDDEPVFRATHDRLAELLPQPDQVTRINYGDYDSVSAKDMFIEAFNAGTGLVSYEGHGGVQLWSSARLFTNDDVSQLNNTNQYPVLLALGCLSGYFAYPADFDSLAEVLLLPADKGIAAALSPTGLTSTVEQQVLAEAWIKATGEGLTLGQALLKAQQAVAQQVATSRAKTVIQTFNLLGDPALKLDLH